jgi:hypothetical protein
MNNVELLIKEKLRAALEAEKRQIASGLLSTPPEPPIADQGPISPVNEDFGKVGRPTKPKAPEVSDSEKRQRMHLNIMNKREQVRKANMQTAKSSDTQGAHAKKRLAQTELSLAMQKMANSRHKK